MQGMAEPVDNDPHNLQPASLRALQEAVASGGNEAVVYVRTPQQLVHAVSAAARHIEITEHLNLTKIDKFFSDDNFPTGYRTLLNVSVHTWSSRVRTQRLR
jgi:hypothetical protein